MWEREGGSGWWQWFMTDSAHEWFMPILHRVQISEVFKINFEWSWEVQNWGCRFLNVGTITKHNEGYGQMSFLPEMDKMYNLKK